MQGHGAQAITPLRVAEECEPSLAATSSLVRAPATQAGADAIARRVSWCSPIPEYQIEVPSPVCETRDATHVPFVTE